MKNYIQKLQKNGTEYQVTGEREEFECTSETVRNEIVPFVQQPAGLACEMVIEDEDGILWGIFSETN